MMLTWLADALRAEGLDVVEVDGWETRSQISSVHYKPDGLVNHHTAPPVPYPVAKLLRSCNLNIKTTGTVYVVAAGYQYDTGRGSSVVLNEVRRDIAPSDTAHRRGLVDDYNANPYFVDIEVDHPGDGSPIPDAQLDALIRADVAICREMGWSANRVIGHLESTARKIDPRWNGNENQMPGIRAAVEAMLGGFAPTTEDDMDRNDWRRAQDALKVLGYDVGASDGIPGAKTLAGTQALQSARKLTPVAEFPVSASGPYLPATTLAMLLSDARTVQGMWAADKGVHPFIRGLRQEEEASE